MKRISGLLLFLAMLLLFVSALADVEISEAVFPDEAFRRYLLDAGFDRNGDGRLSKGEIAKVTFMDCHSRKIKSLQGIGTFTELVELQCYDNLLTEIDVSKNEKLASLGAYVNQLKKIDLSGSKNLVSFSCSVNPVSELVLPDTRKLTWLDVTQTNLKQLDLSEYPILEQLVRAGEPTPYIYGATEEQVNWVSDTSFLAINRDVTLKANGAVLYGGSGKAEAAAEKTEAEEEPAKTAQKEEPAGSAADLSGKTKIARLMKPVFNGKFNTLWIDVPDQFALTIVHENNTPLMMIPDSAADFVAGVILENKREKNPYTISFSIFTSGRWKEYRNLNEWPEDALKEAWEYYFESHKNEYTLTDMSMMEWRILPGGLKILQDHSMLVYQDNRFLGWTTCYGYEISVDAWIGSQSYYSSPPAPSEEDLEVIEKVLNSLVILEE